MTNIMATRFTEYADKYTNKRTFSNVKTLARKANKALGYTGADLEYMRGPEWYEKFTDVAAYLTTNMNNATTSRVYSEMCAIGAMVKGTDLYKPMQAKLRQLKSLALPLENKVFTARPWSELLPLLQADSESCVNTHGRVLATCYKHNYVMRLCEILQTKWVDDEVFNFLDIANLKWIIRLHKNQHKTGPREFPITEAFAKEIQKFRFTGTSVLIGKSNDSCYAGGSCTHSYFGITGYSNIELRNAYEEAHRDDPTELRKMWSEQVLGHSLKTVNDNYIRNTVAEEINKKIKAKPVKPAKPVKIKITITKRKVETPPLPEHW